MRALTLFTDRRGVQSRELPVILERADYFANPRQPDLSAGQIAISDAEAARLGFTRALLPAANARQCEAPRGLTLEGVATVAEALDVVG